MFLSLNVVVFEYVISSNNFIYRYFLRYTALSKLIKCNFCGCIIFVSDEAAPNKGLKIQ